MKNKNLIILIATTFLRSTFIAMLKFFLRSHLQEANVSLETIAGYIGLGGFFAYLIGSPLTYAFRKKTLTLVSGAIAIIGVLIGYIFGYFPLWLGIVLISGIGFGYSLWTIIKTVLLSIEIQNSEHSEARINGMLNVAMLLGILLGSYYGFDAYAQRGNAGNLVMIGGLIIASSITIYMKYDTHFQKKSFTTTLKDSRSNIRQITNKYIRLLVPIAVLRAVSTAIGQKMLEIGINVFHKSPQSALLIVLVGFAGAIVGNTISMFFKRRRRLIAMIFTIIFGLTTIYFPHIIETYDYYITLNIFSCCVGIFFGIAVNLLEGRYFYHIGEDKTKEYGSVAYGIINTGIIFIIMLITNYLGKTLGIKISFFFFGMVVIAMPFLLRKFDGSDISQTS